ncbi:MAG: hypothetical protein ACYC91_17880 [Solirubrobacteraceae bacterium]
MRVVVRGMIALGRQAPRVGLVVQGRVVGAPEPLRLGLPVRAAVQQRVRVERVGAGGSDADVRAGDPVVVAGDDRDRGLHRVAGNVHAGNRGQLHLAVDRLPLQLALDPEAAEREVYVRAWREIAAQTELEVTDPGNGQDSPTFISPFPCADSVSLFGSSVIPPWAGPKSIR